MDIPEKLARHLESGVTTLCRCWRLERRDGVAYGFTDHDGDLSVGGEIYRASDGLTARAFEQTTGLAVDNSEALGILSDAGVNEADIIAGRFDGAAVEAWLVDWSAPGTRALLFRGQIGEIERAGGAFKAELRGLTEALNQPQGRVYQSACPAILGDRQCGVKLSDPAFSITRVIEVLQGGKVFEFRDFGGFADRWFEKGRITMLGGASAGDVGIVKNDRLLGGIRRIETWEAFRGTLAPGDEMRIEAGCDKRLETCRTKFANQVNFRGFPHMPSEDWLMAYPARGDVGSEAGDG